MKKKIVFLVFFISLVFSTTFCLWGQEFEKKAGVTIYKPDKFYKGYTLYNSRLREEATLIDMKGYIVHCWSYPQGFTWHYAELLPNGHILAIIKEDYNRHIGGILLELNWESNVVWKMNIACHHDFAVLDNGNIMVLCREYVNNDAIYAGILKSDCFLEITPDKEIVWEWHADQHALELKKFVNIDFPLPRGTIRGDSKIYPPLPRDWAHTNTVEVLPDNPLAKKDPRFKKGNIIFSMRNIDTIGVIDKETGKILWAWGPGVLDKQHIPTMLENGNILIYDNGSNRRYTKILELDPLKEKIVWEYKASPPESFFSNSQGSSQRLPNGNTFIANSNNGILFEVTPDGEVVWEYRNPDLSISFRNGETRVKSMNIYRSLRYSPEFVERLLSKYSRK